MVSRCITMEQQTTLALSLTKTYNAALHSWFIGCMVNYSETNTRGISIGMDPLRCLCRINWVRSC
jgi:hypothetical protein